MGRKTIRSRSSIQSTLYRFGKDLERRKQAEIQIITFEEIPARVHARSMEAMALEANDHEDGIPLSTYD